MIEGLFSIVAEALDLEDDAPKLEDNACGCFRPIPCEEEVVEEEEDDDDEDEDEGDTNDERGLMPLLRVCEKILSMKLRVSSGHQIINRRSNTLRIKESTFNRLHRNSLERPWWEARATGNFIASISGNVRMSQSYVFPPSSTAWTG